MNGLRNSLLHLKLIRFGLGLFTVVLFLIFMLPLLKPGIPTTHDGEGHVARAANYAVALRQGQIPPRWAPTFWNGFGYPVFNFYYPLLSMVSAPLIIGGIHPELAVKFWLMLSLAGMIACWILIGKKLATASMGLLASTLILLSHYFFNLFYVRGAYGEFLAYVSVSFLFLSFLYFPTSKTKLAKIAWLFCIWLSTMALSLSHNLMAAFLLPISGLVLLISTLKSKITYSALIMFALGILTTSFFWIPALAELRLTVFDQLPTDATKHLVSLQQLAFDSANQGQSHAGIGNEMSFNIGPFSLFILLIASFFALIRQKLARKQLVIFLLVLTWLLLFFVTQYSTGAWETFSFLQVAQFPWRLLGVVMLLLALLCMLVYQQLPRWTQLLTLALLLFLLVQRFTWQVREAFHHPAEHYLNYVQTSTVQDELKPKTWQVPVWEQSTLYPQVTNSTQVMIKKWRGSYRMYELVASTSSTVIEPTMYFPGWEVSVDGQAVPITSNKANGQIAFIVPPGSHQIVTRFTQNTPARRYGNYLSLGSLIIAMGYFGIGVYTSNPKFKQFKKRFK